MMGQPQAENARLALARGDCAEAVTAITTVAAPVTANQASANPITLAERMRPSEYTAAVLRVIEQRAGATSFHNAIDIGTGSGVLLAALARCGAHELWGTDIDPDSLIVADALLAREAADKSVHLLLSDVWRDVPPLAFNVIVANLPHFPAELPPSPDRNRSWSGGGRLVLDDFLNGIAGFLASDGVVWMTHHALANLADTQRILADNGLACETAFTWTVYESTSRIAAVAPSVITAAGPGSLRRIGDYHFVEAHVLEIRHADRRR